MSEIDELVSRALDLDTEVAYADGGIVSKTLLDRDAGTLTLFALDADQNISEHSAPHYALAQVLEGTGEFVIAGETHQVEAGQSLIMPPDVPHAVNAPEKFKMLLVMIKSEE